MSSTSSPPAASPKPLTSAPSPPPGPQPGQFQWSLPPDLPRDRESLEAYRLQQLRRVRAERIRRSSKEFGRQVGRELDDWQVELIDTEVRRVIVLVTRQGGKSDSIALKVARRAIYHPRSLIILTASAGRQSNEGFTKTKLVLADLGIRAKQERVPELDAIPDLPQLLKDAATSLVLSNGSRVISLPCNPLGIRGFSSVHMVVVDEAAFVPPEMFYALSPMLAVVNGQMLVLSTAWGKSGYFYEKWISPREGPGAWHHIGPITAAMIPRLTPEFLAGELRDFGPAKYAREYGCEFQDAVTAVFRAEDIAALMGDSTDPLVLGDLPAEGSLIAQPPRPDLALFPTLTEADLYGDNDPTGPGLDGLVRDSIAAAGR